MTNRPSIKPGDWISLGTLDAVISLVRDSGHFFGDCEIVYFQAGKAANKDARWTGEVWEFVPSPDQESFAENFPRLRPFITQLFSGRERLAAQGQSKAEV